MYRVIVTREVTESAFMVITADSPEAAEEEALRWATNGVSWEVDEMSCGKEPPYVTHIEEV